MIKIVLIFTLLISTLAASIVGNIELQEDLYAKTKNEKSNINKNIKSLAKKISLEKKSYEKLENQISDINKNLTSNKQKLSKAIKKIKELDKQLKNLYTKKDKIEKDVIEHVAQKYSISIGINLINKNSLSNIVDKEVYKIVLNNAMEEVLELDKNYLSINTNIKKNKESTDKLNQFIDEQEKAKQVHEKMQKEQSEILTSLNKKYELYKKSLKDIINEQNKIVSILANLTILEKREKLNLLKNQSKVRYRKYKGDKTIAPLRSYDITKNFGKYKDEVYQKELFNKSVMLKTRIANAKVYNIFMGEIVYTRKNAGSLKNVVIVKHKGEIHTIYAHLDKISPTIKVGKWIQKGYVVGRVNGTLQFQATKNKKYIDPVKLFQ